MGCPTCYETFRDELSRTIASIHGTTSHIGAVPARHRAMQARAEELKRLKKELSEAVQREDYEKAVTLRDQIRKIEAEKEEN